MKGWHPPQIATENAQSFGRICAPCERFGAGRMEAASAPVFDLVVLGKAGGTSPTPDRTAGSASLPDPWLSIRTASLPRS